MDQQINKNFQFQSGLGKNIRDTFGKDLYAVCKTPTNLTLCAKMSKHFLRVFLTFSPLKRMEKQHAESKIAFFITSFSILATTFSRSKFGPDEPRRTPTNSELRRTPFLGHLRNFNLPQSDTECLNAKVPSQLLPTRTGSGLESLIPNEPRCARKKPSSPQSCCQTIIQK